MERSRGKTKIWKRGEKMSDLFKLLQDKNYWYGKYLSSNEAYLQALQHAPEVAIDELELFYGNRESLLKIIERLDESVQAELSSERWKNREPSSSEKTLLQRYIREKDSMITKIVELDGEILVTMEAIKAQGLEKLKILGKGKRALASYKSSNRNEKINKRI